MSFDKIEWKRFRYIPRSIFSAKEEKEKEEKRRADIRVLTQLELILLARK